MNNKGDKIVNNIINKGDNTMTNKGDNMYFRRMKAPINVEEMPEVTTINGLFKKYDTILICEVRGEPIKLYYENKEDRDQAYNVLSEKMERFNQ